MKVLKNTAFIFPGQGSQYAGMGMDICDQSERAREVFYTTDKTLDFPLSRICFHGPEDELKLTANTQPALLTLSIALWELLQDKEIRPTACAGHSLGEYSALVAAGVIPFEDAVKLVRHRGEYMQDAVPVGVGAMAAVMGLDSNTVAEILNDARPEGQVLSVANLNCPGQIVIAGHANAVNVALPLLKDAGARRVVMLPVSAPFHSALMQPARDRLSPEIDAVEFDEPSMRFYSNVTAGVLTDPENIKEKLKEQVTHPVRWEELIRNMIADGITRFVEVGAGRVLSGLVRKIDRSVTVQNISDSGTYASFLESISKMEVEDD
ncbi:MAG: [acyl-carrier-protein] S-malonyltransferase [Acidobacteria bacterium]|nr:MAG: [acyl-carrier-protein] S-malonyltransferase [Acidobacteriota bacterium]